MLVTSPWNSESLDSERSHNFLTLPGERLTHDQTEQETQLGILVLSYFEVIGFFCPRIISLLSMVTIQPVVHDFQLFFILIKEWMFHKNEACWLYALCPLKLIEHLVVVSMFRECQLLCFIIVCLFETDTYQCLPYYPVYLQQSMSNKCLRYFIMESPFHISSSQDETQTLKLTKWVCGGFHLLDFVLTRNKRRHE